MIKFSEILEIIRKKISDKTGSFKVTDGQIAEALGVNQNRISMWKARDTIPFDVLFEFCQKNDMLLDDLLTGRETPHHGHSMARDPGAEGWAAAPVDLDALKTCIDVVERFLTEHNFEIDSKAKAEVIAICYEEIMESEARELPEARVGRFLKLAV